MDSKQEIYSVPLSSLIEKMELENCTPNIDISDIRVMQSDINRPALQLAGFFDFFDSRRIQIIGHVEHSYMQDRKSVV